MAHRQPSAARATGAVARSGNSLAHIHHAHMAQAATPAPVAAAAVAAAAAAAAEVVAASTVAVVGGPAVLGMVVPVRTA